MSSVERGESFAEWESFLSESYVPLAVDPDRGAEFHGAIHRSRMAGFDLSTISSSAQRIRRTKRGIARTEGEFLLGSIVVEGIGRLHQDGRVAVVRAGDMVFYDTSRPYHWEIDESWAQVVVQTPLESVRAEAGAELGKMPTAVALGSHTAAGVVATFFRDLARIEQAAPEHANVLADNGLTLLASAVRLAAGELPTGPPAQALVREHVLAYMRRRCTDPRLNVDEIAQACLLSRRSLYRVFGDEGVGAALRRMRVETARALLLGDRARSMASVAASSGFSSERQFFRAFRWEMGMTPGEFREAHGT
ncbi:helix-turn-helix domain-containing protein [Nocardia sp. NPDC058705]|uniref:AraC-like ligand-binding domain-containing protein n=1 Tax=Nocardia sp. NPDC058705 TaxID=3346609 RepID=UPI0036A3B489